MEKRIQLASYGSNIGSRLLGREIMSNVRPHNGDFDTLIFDFDGVRTSSLSFFTEIVDSVISHSSITKVVFLKMSEMIELQAAFAKRHARGGDTSKIIFEGSTVFVQV